MCGGSLLSRLLAGSLNSAWDHASQSPGLDASTVYFKSGRGNFPHGVEHYGASSPGLDDSLIIEVYEKDRSPKTV